MKTLARTITVTVFALPVLAFAASEEICTRSMPSGIGESQRATLMAECMAAKAKKPPAKAAAPSTPIPLDWAAFHHSTAPQDAKVVARINRMQWYDTCEAWGRQARSNQDPRFRAALVAYLQSERLINGVDLGSVTLKKPEIGMTTCGVLAQLGKPNRLNQTERQSGYSAQMVYRDRGIYVYTEGRDANATVRSVQY